MSILGFNSRTPGGVRLDQREYQHGKAVCFNSRTPGGVRPPSARHAEDKRNVSIHAPREGCDRFVLSIARSIAKFQFTHPGRGATIQLEVLIIAECVSIHAPREGCDSVVQSCVLWGG